MNDVCLLDESVFCCATQKLYDKEQLPCFCSKPKSSLLVTPKYDLQHSPCTDFFAFVILEKSLLLQLPPFPSVKEFDQGIGNLPSVHAQ